MTPTTLNLDFTGIGELLIVRCCSYRRLKALLILHHLGKKLFHLSDFDFLLYSTSEKLPGKFEAIYFFCVIR